MLSQRRFDEAERIVNNAPPHPGAASIFSVLGMVHAVREHWVAAITNYSKVVSLIPEDHSAYHFPAAALVQAGDLQAYRRHRSEILRRFGQTADPVTAERMAKDCLILPPPTADLPTIGRMADVAIAAGSDAKPWPYFQFRESSG